MDDDLYDEFGNFMYVPYHIHDVVTHRKDDLSAVSICPRYDVVLGLTSVSIDETLLELY